MTSLISLPHMVALTLIAMSVQSRTGLASQPGQVPVQGLVNTCTLTGLVSDTSGAKYSPYKSNAGTRSLPSPASIVFAAQVDVQSQSEGCVDFQKKYFPNQDLTSMLVKIGSELGAGVGIDQKVAEQVAKSSEGKIVTLDLSQNFPYELNGKLPFFPLFHAESFGFDGQIALDLNGKIYNFSAFNSTIVNTQAIYGVPAPKDLDDAAKLIGLKRVKEISSQYFPSDGLGRVKFEWLWLHDLKPKSIAAKQEFADGIFEFLKTVAESDFPNSRFFEFNVGGAELAEFGEELVTLSKDQGVLSAKTKQKLVLYFPQLLNLGYFSNQVFSIDEIDLYAALDAFLETDLVALNQIQKWAFSDLAENILNKSGSAVANHPELTSSKALQIANDIIANLNWRQNPAT